MFLFDSAPQSATRMEAPSLIDLLNGLWSLAPAALALFLVIAIAVVLRRWLERSSDPPSSHKTRNQVILLAFTTIGLVLVILMLPIGDLLRGQLLSLIGIVLSAGIALSSTTFLGNLLAGIMLRAVRSYRMGDFISVGDHFGRVSDRGLFHTEIQTEERNLTTLPNMYLVTNPVTTVRTSGTIVAATVSLGYEVARAEIEQLLLQAAERAGLEDPFVTTGDLGDFSVTYRVAGLLTEVRSLITARSRLRGEMLDSLHGGEVEIVSPNYMNTRSLSLDERVIPRLKHRARKSVVSAPAPEEILFDKADDAEEAEELEENLADVSGEIEAVQSEIKDVPDEEREELESRARQLKEEREQLARRVEELKEKRDSD